MPMNRMMLAFLLISAVIVFGGPIIEPAISSDLFQSSKFLDILKDAGCTLCDDLSNCTQGDLMLSPNEMNFDLQVMFFNGTITRSPIVNAPLVIYIHNESMEEIYKMYTDNEGVARFSFDQWSGACHDYTIFHCKDQYGCDFTTCIDAVGIDRTALGITDIDDILLAPDGTDDSGDPQDPPNVLPAYTSYRYCPPPPSLGTTMPVFCLPLVLIMMFLLGSMFLSGKNPFIWFDFSSPRMGKYIRYTARGRGFGFDMMSIASAAVTVVSIAKNPKAMMKKDQARLKKGGAFGGIAATVRGGVKAVPGKRAIKRMAKKGAKWGKGGGKQGAAAVWGTVKGGLKGSAIGQIVQAGMGAKGGGWGAFKAVGLALLRYSSFGQLVNAIQTAAQVWAVAGSVGEAIKDRDAWKGTATVKTAADGKEHDVVMTTKGGKFVPMVDGKVMSKEEFEKFQGKLIVKDKEQIVSLRNEGFDQIQRVNRTVLFFRPLEIANRNETLAGNVDDTLKDAKKDATLTYKDPSGAEIKITAGELKDIASQEKDNPSKAAGVIVSVTDKKGKTTTKIVSAETFLDMKAAGTKVERKGDVSLSGVMAGLDAGSKTVQNLGIKGAMGEAKSIEGMKQMVAATDLMYKQLETIKANHTANFNKSREALSKAVKALTPEAVGATMKIGTETKTVADWVKEGKTDLVVTALAATKPGEAPKELTGLANAARNFYDGEAAHTNNFVSIFNNSSKFSDSVQKGYELKGTSLLKAQVHAQTVITQLTAVANNRTFDVSLLEGIDFSRSTGMKRSKKAMMASFVANKGLNLKNEAEREKYLKGIETQKAKITDIAPEKRTPEQRRLLEIYTAIGNAADTLNVVGAKHPEFKENVKKIQELGFSGLEVTQKEALLYKSQALASMADLFSRPAPPKAEPSGRAMGMVKQVGGPAAMGTDYRMEKAALTMLYDISANPKQGLNTLSMFNALKGAKNDPARFDRMAAAFENYSLSDYKPPQRYAVFNKLQLQDATNRFGDAVRIHAISGHVGAEDAISAAVKKVADSTAVSFINKERAEYKSASDTFVEKYTELRKAKDSGIKGAKLKKYEDAAAKAEQNMKRERNEYYQASFNALGSSAKVDAIIKEHVPPGSNERNMWNAYQDFRKTAEKAPDYNAAAKKLADVKGKPGDPFKLLRTKVEKKDPKTGKTKVEIGGVASFKTTVGLTAPTPVRFSYNPAQVTHSEVFDGVQSSGQYSYAQLKAMGYIR